MAIDRRTLIRNMFILSSVKYIRVPLVLAANKHFSGDKDLTLGNQYLEMHFEKRGDKLSLSSFVNRLSARRIQIKSDDFSIGMEGQDALTAKDFLFKDYREDQTKEGRSLFLHFRHHSKDIALVICYELGHHDFFVRRQLVLTTTLPLELRQLNVWELGFDGVCSFQENEPPQNVSAAFGFSGTKGFGFPVFMDDSFWGLEYPAGYNQYQDGVLTLTHFPGRTITGRFPSKKAVLGVSESKDISSRFKHYIETILASPPSVKQLFVDYNTWTTLMPATKKNSLDLIEHFQQKLFNPNGVNIDSYTIDEGWDNKNSLWDIDKERFQSGFSPLVDALKRMNAKLGLWLSPSSGYDHAPWLASRGYPKNDTWDWFMCQSDPRYSADLTKKVTGLTERYGLNFFKFDGFCAMCNATDHPWHLPGNYSKEANVDAYINFLTAIRKANPDIFLDPTSGMWLSPWWLQHAESVYGDMFDGVPPAIAPTPIPGYGHFISRDALLRKRIRENPGFPSNAIEHLGIYTPDYDTLYDEIIAVIGRGSRLLSLYLNPYELLRNDQDWTFLAGALRWVRSNASVFWQTQLILGDPLKREPYGYAHFHEGRGILALYNPFIESRTVSIPLNADSGRTKNKALQEAEAGRHYIARVIYPYLKVIKTDIKYAEPVHFLLAGHETVIVQIEPLDPKAVSLKGARYMETGRSGKSIMYNVFGRPGEPVELSVTGSRNTTLNLTQPNAGRKDAKMHLTFPGNPQRALVENSSLVLETENGKSQLRGGCIAHVPEGSIAEMHILFSPVLPSGYQPHCEVKVNGSAVEFNLSRPTLTPPHMQLFAELPVSDWSYISFKISSGKSELSFCIDASANENGRFRAETGGWLWIEHPLENAGVSIEYQDMLPLPDPEILPVPARINMEREIITAWPNQVFTKGENLTRYNASVVYLDEILPVEVAMSLGQLQLNKSASGADLIVAGRKFARGLGTNAYGRIRYDISGKSFKRFQCLVGLNEDGGNAAVIFEVWIDDRKIFSSTSMRKQDQAKAVDLDILHASFIEIRTLNGIDSDDLKGTYGDWCEARLIH
ncbi:MAG: NPCBM/NEW2 domain-containing protein [Bacteroidota bacterium]|nr:NPCBM/NEW2 domain-containing protein [Bacteroidota bacterium]